MGKKKIGNGVASFSGGRGKKIEEGSRRRRGRERKREGAVQCTDKLGRRSGSPLGGLGFLSHTAFSLLVSSIWLRRYNKEKYISEATMPPPASLIYTFPISLFSFFSYIYPYLSLCLNRRIRAQAAFFKKSWLKFSNPIKGIVNPPPLFPLAFFPKRD